MKTLIKPLVLMIILSFSQFSCSVQDEITAEDETQISASDLTNQDDDPEIEEPQG